MATIGGVSCNIARGGTINGKRERVAIDHMPGSNSPTLQKLGLGDGTFALTLFEYGTLNEVTAWFVSLEALKSTVISITDERDKVWPQRAVGQVGDRVLQTAICPGTSDTHRGEIQIRGVAL